MSEPAPGSLRAEQVAPIVVAERNGVVESIHHGVGVVVGAAGEVVASIGDPTATIYPRSALKPFQSAAMVDLGLDLAERLMALVSASHSGEPMHQDGVREILDLHGLAIDDLANTPSRPLGAAARHDARMDGITPSSLQQNCSGKHAGMLATCAINGWPTEGYLSLEHPLQQAIVEFLDRNAGGVRHIGIDGCGAPTHVLGVSDLARALGGLAASGSVATRSMSAHPLMAGGTGRDVSMWMEAVPGLVGKEGAQAVMVLAMADGRAAALKIADGSDAARQAATVQALRYLGVDVDGEFAAIRDRVAVPVLGHGEPVGVLRPLPWIP